ncbi:16S rRNA (cytidine(1402)-2'-O)-methyltransferase [Blattabacterium cuenoti]|uniref:16S rRNA (cytidine(1402)-2'-O)-methyltransferase n=1 Tax=Blattabacterium cuenoti TaxID=1653831 RepID=UPI00163C61FA|nr:16S rRNA (cytidine(1402)-2'-O)-methyltransferase [Blattabacterium cuenoti]
MLYIVPTPIGNLEDITFRSLRILKEVNLILVENYQISRNLLKFYNINTPTTNYHNYNERNIIPSIIDKMKKGEKIALISDAGTPCISDPGFLLIRTCIEKHISIECLPGPTSIIPALVNSGLPIHEFTFIGFLPKKKRQSKLHSLSKETRTIILYESPYRLIKTLNDIKKIFGKERKIVVCKEISKIFQQIFRGNISEIIFLLHQNFNKILGEYTILIDRNNSK